MTTKNCCIFKCNSSHLHAKLWLETISPKESRLTTLTFEDLHRKGEKANKIGRLPRYSLKEIIMNTAKLKW